MLLAYVLFGIYRMLFNYLSLEFLIRLNPSTGLSCLRGAVYLYVLGWPGRE